MAPDSSSTDSRRTMDLVAELGRDDLVGPFVLPFLERDDAFALVADIDDDVVADDIEHAAFDDLVDVEFFFVGEGDEGMVGFVGGTPHGLRELLFEILFGKIVLPKQIPINHAGRSFRCPVHKPAAQARLGATLACMWARLSTGIFRNVRCHSPKSARQRQAPRNRETLIIANGAPNPKSKAGHFLAKSVQKSIFSLALSACRH